MENLVFSINVNVNKLRFVTSHYLDIYVCSDVCEIFVDVITEAIIRKKLLFIERIYRTVITFQDSLRYSYPK